LQKNGAQEACLQMKSPCRAGKERHPTEKMECLHEYHKFSSAGYCLHQTDAVNKIKLGI
jgi:hypothetical protein